MNQNQVLLYIIDEEVDILYLKFSHLILVDKFPNSFFEHFFQYIVIKYK